MTKEGYQPIKTKKTTKIIPPNTGSNVRMKKDGYTWEDLDRSFWEGFDNAKDKMEKRIAELEAQIEEMKSELHHRLVSPSHDDSDCLDKIIGLDRLWQFGQEF